MILFFNLVEIEKLANGNLVKILSILKKLYSKNIFSPNYKLVGSSYLLNPGPLFSSSVDIIYIIQYIKLAAKRDYLLYKFNKYKSLDLSYFPDISISNIKTNPLLKITDKEIHFLLEDKTTKEQTNVTSFWKYKRQGR